MSGTWLPQPVRGGGARQPPLRTAQGPARDTYSTSAMAHPLNHVGPEYTHARPTASLSHVSAPLSDATYQSVAYDDGLDDFDREVLEDLPVEATHRDLDEYGRPLGGPPVRQPPESYDTRSISTAPHPFPDARLPSGAMYDDHGFEPDLEAHVPAARAPAHRLRELHTSRQQPTPPMHSASYGRSPLPQHAATGYAPASSSPTARLTTRRQQTGFVQPTPSSPASAASTQLPQRTQPPQTGTPIVQGIPLISLRQALPDKLRAIFPFELFNAVQSKCFDVIYNTGDNVVVAAPTGSGKTALLELAICRLALNRGNENFKIVYQAPTKALCSEKARDWESKFSHMSLKCAELTGDTSQAEMRRVGDASIIVTTPEKWDSITRKWHDHRRLLQMVELFLIDEVHILKDMRGATLEAVVSRMKTIGANVRFIALSATVPNSEDIAQWLGRNHTTQQLPAHRETFGEEFRPVKLEKFVYGFQAGGNEFMFDKFLDSKLPALLARHSHRKPILIFCFTRKSCESTASVLAEYVSGRPQVDELWPMPTKRIAVLNRDLQEVVRFGVAFHHAGLDIQDRNAVEQNFLKGQLSVICCTSTLAVGVNLPCHTAVLKGTVGYADDKVQEFSDLEVMQMLGRAGRPQFDDSATAIILTRAHNKERYERMVSGHEVLESTLHLNLIEHLNSEVCLGTVNDLQSAKTWLAGTFLNVRLRRNPKHYNMTEGVSNPSQIDDKLEEICERDMKLLQEAELVTDGQTFKCTDYGRSMSRYMVECSTMKNLLQIPRAVGMEALLTALCQASEFREFRFKPAERTIFRDVNQSQLIMYPIKEVVNQTWHKISLIVQAELGSVQYADSGEAAKARRQLMMEKKMIFEKLQRLARAVIDCKGHDRDAIAVKNALELARALSAESWEGRATQLTQVPNIGPAGMRKLASKGVRSVLELADKEADEIERLMSRNPPFGKKLKEDLDKFPRLGLDVAVFGHTLQPRQKEEPVVINVGATIRYLNRKTAPNWLGKPPLLTFMVEFDDGTLAYFWRGNMRKVDKQNGLEVKFTIGLRRPSDRLTCHLSCEEIVGTVVSKALNHGVSESVFARADRAAGPVAPARPKPAEPEYLDDDDGVDDYDLIVAAEQAMSSLHKGSTPKAQLTSEDHPHMDDAVAVSPPRPEPEPRDSAPQDFDDVLATQYSPDGAKADEQETWREPVQLPSGKWQCNHACSGGAPTKSGKPCTHRCCKEGLDKPRKRPQPKPKKRKEEEVGNAGVVVAVQSTMKPSHTQGPPLKRQKAEKVNLPVKSGGIKKYLDWKPDPSKTLADDGSMAKDRLGTSKSPARVTEMELDDNDMEFPLLPPASRPMPSAYHPLPPAPRPQLPELPMPHSEKNPKPSQAAEQSRKAPDVMEITGFEGLPYNGGYDLFEFPTKRLRIPGFRSGAKDRVFYQGGNTRSGSVDLEPVGSSRENPEYIPSDYSDLDELFDGDIDLEDTGSPDTSVPVETPDPEPHKDETDSTSSEIVVSVETPKNKLLEGEPDWVAEFDPELVDIFRGYVTFV